MTSQYVTYYSWQICCDRELPWQQGSWGQHEAHLGPTGPRLATWTLLSGSWTPSQYSTRRLSVRHHKVSTILNWVFRCSHCFAIWRLANSKAIKKFLTSIPRFRDFMRSYDNTSYFVSISPPPPRPPPPPPPAPPPTPPHPHPHPHPAPPHPTPHPPTPHPTTTTTTTTTNINL